MATWWTQVVQSQISIPLQFLCTLCYKLVHSAHCSLALLEAINDYFFLHSSPFSPDDDLAFFRRRAHFPQARSSYTAYTQLSVFMGGANKNLLLSYYMLNLFACKHKQLAGAQKKSAFSSLTIVAKTVQISLACCYRILT